MRFVELPPDAPTLLESMRAIGYSFEAAVADILDNSLTAGATSIDILFDSIGEPYVAILDDGLGMTASELRTAMRGKVVVPGDDAYESARQIWNGAVDHRPALLAICETQEDVKAAVRVAQAHQLPPKYRGDLRCCRSIAAVGFVLAIDITGVRNADGFA